MKLRSLLCVSAFALAALSLGQNAPVPQYFQDAATTIGAKGTLNADGSYRINIPRSDVQFTNARGMIIHPDLGLVTYIAFSGTGDSSLAVGDIAMLEGEIDRVIDALRAGGFDLVALHNHMTTEQPRLFYMHFQAVGKTSQLASTFKKAVGILGTPVTMDAPPQGEKPQLDSDALAGVFGFKPQVLPSGIVKFTKARTDVTVTVDDQKFLPGMGLSSWAAFAPCSCGLTMVMGDTCCLRSDLQAAIDAYRKAGIHITAIHNHVFGANQQVAFVHYEGEGEANQLAQGIKACWDKLGAK